MLHDHQGRYPQAIKRYKQVIDRDSTYKEAYFNLGVLYKEAGVLDGAVEAYRHLTALDSTYANAYFNMGIILQEIGQYPDALSAFNQFVYYSSDAQLIGSGQTGPHLAGTGSRLAGGTGKDRVEGWE